MILMYPAMPSDAQRFSLIPSDMQRYAVVSNDIWQTSRNRHRNSEIWISCIRMWSITLFKPSLIKGIVKPYMSSVKYHICYIFHENRTHLQIFDVSSNASRCPAIPSDMQRYAGLSNNIQQRYRD